MDKTIQDELGYCARCNRKRKKGEWKSVIIKDPICENKQTSKGIQKMIRGKCPECGSIIIAMRGKAKQENKKNAEGSI